MEQTEYPKFISEWMTTIKESVRSNRQLCLEHVEKLEEYARAVRSEYLLGFCQYQRGYACYLDAELSQSIKFFSSALNHLIDGECWHLAVKTYNAMGNIADYQGDVSLAIDCYLKGLAMSRENDLPKLEFDILANIGNVYFAMDDLANAKKMFRECERLKQNGAEVYPASVVIVEANLALCYVRMKEYEKAELRLKMIKEVEGSANQNMDQISISLLETEIYHASGDMKKRNAAIKRLNEMELDPINVLDALNELCQHAMLLLEIGKTEEFLSLLNKIEGFVDSPSAVKQALELWLAYYEKMGDEENYAKKAVNYYKVVRAQEEERNKIVSHNITTRMHLEAEESRRKEVEKTNLMLKQKSERDALTGMNNRYKLNEMAEAAFQSAYLKGTPLTFGILDIDCYKEYNDHYGHQAGDECLIRIADAIRSLEEFDGVHTARYGGDEFVIIYEDYSKQDVEKMAKRLQDLILGLRIEHKYSKVSDCVTISQGLFHKIPGNGKKPWDFLYGADMALYGVKSRTKDGFHVVTSFEEARMYSKGE